MASSILLGCGSDSGASDAAVRDASSALDGSPAADSAVRDAQPVDGSSTDAAFSFGSPIEATALQWTWVPFERSRCMDGSSTGIGINPNPASQNLLIWVQGGGACYSDLSCIATANPDGFGESKLTPQLNAMGVLFDRTHEPNPFRDWNMVFVPYCSGDLHFGTNQSVGGRAHLGFRNMTAYLERLVPTFADADAVVLSGSSAGGYGAIANFEQTQDAFGTTPVHLLQDSSPMLGDAIISPCLQQRWRTWWGYDSVLPRACDGCVNESGGGFEEILHTLVSRYPNNRFALIASLEDDTLRRYFNGCEGSLLPIFAEPYRAEQQRMTPFYQGAENANVFLVPGTRHVFLNGMNSTVADVVLADWLGSFATGDPAWSTVTP